MQFETALRQIDPSVNLPYWDWALDSQNPLASPVLAPDAFGGDGGADLCVRTGAFAGWKSTNSNEPPRCLQRKIDGKPWTNSATMAALTANIADCKFFCY